MHSDLQMNYLALQHLLVEVQFLSSNKNRFQDLKSSDGEDDDANKEYGDAKDCDEKEDSTYNLPLNKMSLAKKDIEKIPSFIDALKLLSYPEYRLVNAYPTSCQVHAIVVAVPTSSASTERSFSALARVKKKFPQQWCKIVLSRYLS